MMPTDAELLRRYSEDRSEEAFAELVRRHLRPVYAVALRKVGGQAHLAQDVAQAVFTDLARKSSRLSRHPALEGWLFSSVHFAAAQLRRAERRRQTREHGAHLMHALHAGAAPETDWEPLRPLLDDLIRDLGGRDRHALLLRYYEGQTFAEIGTRLNLTEEGARSRVNRALDQLSTRLAKRGVTSTAIALATVLAAQTSVAMPAGLAASVTGTAIAAATTGGATVGFFTIMNSKITAACAIVLLLGTGLIVELHIAGSKPPVQVLAAPPAEPAAPAEVADQPALPDPPADLSVQSLPSPAVPPPTILGSTANGGTVIYSGTLVLGTGGSNQGTVTFSSTGGYTGTSFVLNGGTVNADLSQSSRGASPNPTASRAATPVDPTVLLVDLDKVFGGSNLTADLSAEMRQLRAAAATQAANLTGDQLAAFNQSIAGSLTTQFEAFKADELKRILSVVEIYRTQNSFRIAYDSSQQNSSPPQSYGLELLPPGVNGQDGTNQIIALLNQADAP